MNDQGGGRMDISEEVTATLRAQEHGHPPCVLAAGFCKECSAQSRGVGFEMERAPTLRAGAIPAAIALENHPMDGRIKIDESGTVQTLFVPLRAYDVSIKGDPACNQGGITVVEGPTYAMTPCTYTQIEKEKAPTLTARDFKDPTVVNRGYSVRRLTPTECSRLQGFPDFWCADLDTPEPTGEDIAFWTEAWETHRRVVGGSTRPKSRNQIIKWLQHPHSDAAEYKMWGNGVALPNVFFVLAGIVWSTQLSGQ